MDVSSSSEKNTAPAGNDSTSRTQRTDRDFHECEKTRTRKFSSKWQVGHPWLRNEEKGMICEWCTEHRQGFKEGSSRKRARLEKHPQAEVEVVEVYEDATATPEPAQKIVVEPEEEEQEEDHVQFNDKGGNEADSDDEGMISDYDSEPEMSEDDVLKYIANEL